MPTCSICGEAYLDGEGHKCPRRQTSVAGALGGMIAGAFFGPLLFLIVGDLSRMSGTGLGAIVYGVLIGAFVGAVLGARFGPPTA